ncbi:MAG: hypothetical protein ACI8X5_004269 [Planctomycetota bacterium]|jgi:hypothetical protein
MADFLADEVHYNEAGAFTVANRYCGSFSVNAGLGEAIGSTGEPNREEVTSRYNSNSLPPRPRIFTIDPKQVDSLKAATVGVPGSGAKLDSDRTAPPAPFQPLSPTEQRSKRKYSQFEGSRVIRVR